MRIQGLRELRAPVTINKRGNGDAVAGGLPEISPAMVDVDEGLDGGQLRDQLVTADMDGVSSWPAVARLDDSVSSKYGTDGGPPANLAAVA